VAALGKIKQGSYSQYGFHEDDVKDTLCPLGDSKKCYNGLTPVAKLSTISLVK